MRIRRRYSVLLVVGVVAGLAVAGIAYAATTSTFTFKATPSTAPKNTYKAGSLFTDLETHYTNPGNNNPGGAVDRTQIYLDKNFKVDPTAATKCSSSQLSGKTMAQAMAACSTRWSVQERPRPRPTACSASTAACCCSTASPQGGNPTLQVFTRVQASNPSNITCGNPATNSQGNATILLTGVYKPTTGLYSKILDVQHITQSASFPLTSYKTTVKHGNYASARCAAADHLWHMKVV